MDFFSMILYVLGESRFFIFPLNTLNTHLTCLSISNFFSLSLHIQSASPGHFYSPTTYEKYLSDIPLLELRTGCIESTMFQADIGSFFIRNNSMYTEILHMIGTVHLWDYRQIFNMKHGQHKILKAKIDLYIDTGYNDKICDNDNLNVTKPSLKRWRLMRNYAKTLHKIFKQHVLDIS